MQHLPHSMSSMTSRGSRPSRSAAPISPTRLGCLSRASARISLPAVPEIIYIYIGRPNIYIYIYI